MRITKVFRLTLCFFRCFPSFAVLRLDERGSSQIGAIALFLLALLLLKPGLTNAQASEQQIEISFHAGQAALRQGDFVRATQEFKKVLSLDPGLLEAEVNLGLAYQSLLDYDAAARSLSHALQERPNLHGPTILVRMDYLKLGSPEKAAP